MRISALHLTLPVVAVALLAGCSSPAAPVSSPTASPTVSPTSSSTPTASPAPTGGSEVDPNAPDGQCADADLSVDIAADPGGAGAGSVPYVITFTNSGPECVLEGAPGVSVRGDNDSSQIGEPAEQQGTATPVTLSTGGTAVAALTVVNIGTDGGPLGSACKVTAGEGYRVYAPHSFEPVFVKSSGVAACSSSSDFMQVGTVTAG